MNHYLISFILIIITVVISNNFVKKNRDTDWYRCIEPSITPPGWVFSAAWSIIYLLLFFAFGKILKSSNRFVISLFILNLFLQVVWSYFYFTKKRIDIALALIQFLLLSTVIIINLTPDMTIKYLLYPYLCWLTFAATLNILSLKKQCEGL